MREYGYHLKVKQEIEMARATFETMQNSYREKIVLGQNAVKEGIYLEQLDPNDFVDDSEVSIRRAAAADRRINYQNLMQLINDSDEAVRKAAEANFLCKISPEFLMWQETSFKMEMATNSDNISALRALLDLHNQKITTAVFANPKYIKAETKELNEFLADQNAYKNVCEMVAETAKDNNEYGSIDENVR